MIRALLLVIALVSGGWAVFLISGPQPQPVIAEAAPAPIVVTAETTVAAAEPPVLAKVSILAARTPVDVGEVLLSENLHWIEWPEDYLLPQFILQSVQPEALLRLDGQLARLRFAADEPLRRDALSSRTTGTLSQSLTPGMRAVAVRVTLDTAAGGFVLPNDRVDVLHTSLATAGGEAASRVIVSNARVVALDQITERGDGKTVMVERTVTLELDRAGTESVASAQQTGMLTLALRAARDMDDEAAPEVPPLAQLLSPGMRAVVLPNVEIGAGGKVRIGDRVDITHTKLLESGAGALTMVIVSNARVIGIEQPPNGGEMRGLSRDVTVELDRSAAEAVTAAREMGRLALMLRAAADSEEPQVVQAPFLLEAEPAVPVVRVRRAGQL